MRLSTFTGLLAIGSVFGCNNQSADFAYRDTIDTAEVTANDILREVGRVYCAAVTFESRGIYRSRDPNEKDGLSFRWVFGPRGECRFEHDDVGVIFDGRYMAFQTEGSIRVEYKFDRCAADLPKDMKAYPGARHSASSVMVIGMMGRAGSFPEVAARLAGPGHIIEQLDAATLSRAEKEPVEGVLCEKIVALNDYDERTVFWVDRSLGVIRKWEVWRGDQFAFSASYCVVRVNQPLIGDEFTIPADVIERFRTKNDE